ncbi:MAG: tetratricopeptide repeat protein [Candidatus Poribacteria bacterium]|nr:tetratricopeptide repeat protein [Candidatus Poribacteria bacterium]
MKYLGMFTIFVFIAVSFALGRGSHAQTDVLADETPELVPLTDADTTLSADMTRAADIYAKLMWAAYCRTGERNIRKSKIAYDALIEELELDSESIEDKVLSAQGISFIYTERAALRSLPRLQDINGAEEDARKAIQLNPENVEAKWILAKILKERYISSIDRNGRGNRGTKALEEEMLSVGQQIIELDPDHGEAHYYIGGIARYLGKIGLAITSYKALTRILPFKAEYHWELGELYEVQNLLEEALLSYERVITIRPEEIRVWNRLGQLYLQTGDDSAAVRSFQTVLESLESGAVPRSPRNLGLTEIDAHSGISLAYQAQGNFEKAEHHITSAIALLEKRALSMRSGTRTSRARSTERIELAVRIRDTRYTLAQIYLRFNQAQKAVDTFEKILDYDDKYVPALTGIGIAYQMLDDVTQAENYLRKAIEQPSQEELPDAYNALGYLYAEQGIKLDEAATLIRRALKSAPTSGAYLDSLGLVYFKQGKLDAAIENLEQANHYLPDTPEILLHLAEAYLEKGLKEKALQTLENAMQIEPDNVELRQKLDIIKSGR